MLALAGQCWVYAAIHMLLYICCYTYAAIYMLLYICCYIYAAIYMLLYIRGICPVLPRPEIYYDEDVRSVKCLTVHSSYCPLIEKEEG